MASSRNPPTFPRKSANAVAVAEGLFQMDRMRKAAATNRNAFFRSMLNLASRLAPARTGTPAWTGPKWGNPTDVIRQFAMTPP
jgi:hypothetical protein